MDNAATRPLATPLTAAETAQVQRAAAAAGQSVETFARNAVLAAANDPFLLALEQAADTIAARERAARTQHDYTH